MIKQLRFYPVKSICTSVLDENCSLDAPRIQSPSNQNLGGQLSRSITVAGDRTPSRTDRTFQYQATMDEGDVDSPTTDRSTAPKLRTFGGWKRDTGHLDKSRLTKGLMRSHVNLSYSCSLTFVFFFVSDVQ